MTEIVFEPVWHKANEKSQGAQITLSPDLLSFLTRVPHHVARTLTAQQLSAIDKVVSTPLEKRPHAIDYRVSIPFLGRRYYVTLLCGRERRSVERLRIERQISFERTTIAYAVLCAVLSGVLVSAAVIGLYFIKSIAGIDLFQGHSVLHDLFLGN